jgi:hypothetical protein
MSRALLHDLLRGKLYNQGDIYLVCFRKAGQAMNPLNQVLRDTFLFSSRDLLANRAGRLSPLQEARQQALGASLKVGIAFFIIVMLGSLVFFGVASVASGTFTGFNDPDTQITLSILAGVFGLILVVGYFSSRKHTAVARSKLVQKAEGQVQRGTIREDAAFFEIKVGRTKLRLLTETQLEAFNVDLAYRVYYIAGPTPTILSAEVIGTEDEAAAHVELESPVEHDAVIKSQKRARRIVAIVALLSLCFPFLMLLAGNLSGPFPLVMFGVLLAVAFLFVHWATT